MLSEIIIILVVTYYREEDCIPKLCKELRKIGVELLNTEKAEAQPLTSKKKKDL